MAITLGRKPTEPTADIYIAKDAVLGRASERHALAVVHMSRALGRVIAGRYRLESRIGWL